MGILDLKLLILINHMWEEHTLDDGVENDTH